MMLFRGSWLGAGGHEVRPRRWRRVSTGCACVRSGNATCKCSCGVCPCGQTAGVLLDMIAQDDTTPSGQCTYCSGGPLRLPRGRHHTYESSPTYAMIAPGHCLAGARALDSWTRGAQRKWTPLRRNERPPQKVRLGLCGRGAFVCDARTRKSQSDLLRWASFVPSAPFVLGTENLSRCPERIAVLTGSGGGAPRAWDTFPY